MGRSMRVLIASVPENERVVAEIYNNDEMLATINQEQEIMTIEIYPRSDGKFWQLPLEEVLGTLKLAQDRLLGQVP